MRRPGQNKCASSIEGLFSFKAQWHHSEFWAPNSDLAGNPKLRKKKLRIDILVHNWTSKKYVPVDILNMCRFYFGLSRNDSTKKTKTRPKKSDAFGGQLLVPFWCLKYDRFLRDQHKIYKY